jgi:hypothetical protein
MVQFNNNLLPTLQVFQVSPLPGSQNSSAHIGKDYTLGSQRIGISFLEGVRDFSLLHSIRIGFAAHPASYPVGTDDFFLVGTKWPERAADHSSSSITDVKNPWSYTFTPQYIPMAYC